MNFLFVCTAGVNRSPTFAKWMKEHFPKHDSRSAGTFFGYPWKLDKSQLEWASRVYVMDWSHKAFILAHFPEFAPKVSVIGISDEYEPDQPELIELIGLWAEEESKNW